MRFFIKEAKVKKGLMIKDTITIGTIAGLIGSFAIMIPNVILGLLGLEITPGWEPFADLFLVSEYMHTWLGYFVGFLGQFFIAASWGVVMAYILRFTGKDFYWLKGIGLGTFTWFFTAGIMLRLLNISEQFYHQPADQLMVPFNQITYGLITAYIIYRFGDFSTAGEPVTEVKTVSFSEKKPVEEKNRLRRPKKLK